MYVVYLEYGEYSEKGFEILGTLPTEREAQAFVHPYNELADKEHDKELDMEVKRLINKKLEEYREKIGSKVGMVWGTSKLKYQLVKEAEPWMIESDS